MARVLAGKQTGLNVNLVLTFTATVSVALAVSLTGNMAQRREIERQRLRGVGLENDLDRLRGGVTREVDRGDRKHGQIPEVREMVIDLRSVLKLVSDDIGPQRGRKR